jgi:hypothetical protein
MNNMLTKFAAIAATSATVSVAVAFSANNPAQAIAFNYSFQTNTGYSGTGNFSYDETTAPTTISEAGAGPTGFLQSLSLSVFAPNGNLLDSGSTVVNGVSSSPFLQFEFNTLTKKLSVLDTNTSSSGNDVSYFITNFFDPNNNRLNTPSTSFNLFSFTQSTNTTTFLGTAPTIEVAATPEPASVLGLLAFGALGATLKRHKKLAAQKAEA